MKIKHDLYCWQCCKPDTNLQCSSCIRSFHSNCVNELNGDIDSDKWICSVCINCKETEDADKIKELQVLPILIGRISSAAKYNALKRSLESPQNTEHNLVNPINWNNVFVKSHAYSSFNQFYLDICWIVHNCVIVYKDGDERIKQAKNLQSYITNEIELIRKCPECYANANKRPRTWFKSVCSEPHLIVWAKLPGFAHWPAKVIEVVDEQQVHVQFFGDHRYSDLTPEKCYLFSETNPRITRYSTSPTTPYNKAIKEAKDYIQNICNKYGSFKYDENKTVFDSALLDEYIEQMIPGIVEYRRLALHKNQEVYDDNVDTIILDSDEDEDEEEAGPFLDLANSEDSTTQGSHEEEVSQSIAPEEAKLSLSAPATEPVCNKNMSISLERIDEANTLLVNKTTAKILKRGNDMLDNSKEPAKKKVRFIDEDGDELAEVFVFTRNDYEQISDSDQDDERSEDDAEPAAPLRSSSVRTESTSGQSQRNVIELKSCYELSAQDAEIAQGILQSVYGNVLNLLHQNRTKVEALNNEISRLKKEHNMSVASLKDANYRLQMKFDEVVLQKDNEIGMMQANHEIAIASYERVVNQTQNDHAEKMQSLEQKHASQIAAMERQIQEVTEDKANFKRNIEQKYLDIIEQIKKDAEESRIKCKGCKKSLQGQVYCGDNHFVFCDDTCEKMWQKWTELPTKPT